MSMPRLLFHQLRRYAMDRNSVEVTFLVGPDDRAIETRDHLVRSFSVFLAPRSRGLAPAFALIFGGHTP